jgi:predicted phosphodiesterase
MDPERLINDFTAINDMTIALYNNLHDIAQVYLKICIEKSRLPVVVITHHIPSYFEKSHMDRTIECFASDCDDLIKPPVKLWIYGHTHVPNEAKMNDVILLCNLKRIP